MSAETPIERLTRLPGSDDGEEAIVTAYDAGLAGLDRARVLLANALEAMDFSAQLDIEAQARAAAAFFEKGTEAHAQAAKIVILAATTQGQMTKRIEVRPGKRTDVGKEPSENVVHRLNTGITYQYDEPTKKQVLASYGISVKDAARNERLADIPETQRRGYIDGCIKSLHDKGGKAPSIDGLLKYVGHRSGKKPAQKKPKATKKRLAIGECKHCPVHCPKS